MKSNQLSSVLFWTWLRFFRHLAPASVMDMISTFSSGKFFVEINDFLETYTFTASTDSALPNLLLATSPPCFGMRIWPSCHLRFMGCGPWSLHHSSSHWPKIEPAWKPKWLGFLRNKSCGFGAGGFLGFEFGVVCPSANPQVEREDSARGGGGLDVFQLSVGLWFHTSRVLWKMLRLTLFRDGHHVKSCAPWVMAQGIFQDISIQQQIAGAQHFWVHLSAETQQSGWKPQEWVESWGSVWGWGDHWTLQ